MVLESQFLINCDRWHFCCNNGQSTYEAVTNTFSIVKNVFQGEDYDYSGVIDEVVQKATKARKDGLLSLEADLGKMREGFLKMG